MKGQKCMHVLADIDGALADTRHHLGHDVLELHGHHALFGQFVHLFGDGRNMVRMLTCLAGQGQQFATQILQRCAGLFGEAHVNVGGVGDPRPNFMQRLHDVGQGLADIDVEFAGAGSQIANFISHHGEAAAGLTSARRFNGGIEGEQIGLFGNAGDVVQ